MHVVPLKFQELFVLGVVNDQHFVLLPFYLFLEVNVVICCFHQANSQITRDDNIHDVDLFDHYSVNLKFLCEVIFKVLSQFCFNISYFGNPLFLDEVSDAFITFFLKKFFKSVWAEIIEKFLDVFTLEF